MYILYQSWESGIGIATRARGLKSAFKCRYVKICSPQHNTVRGAQENMVFDQELNRDF